MAYLEEVLLEFRKGAKIRSSMWSKKAYIHLKDGKILDESGLPYTIPAIAFHINDWELYQEPIDWEYIIKNKCLCRFWNPGEEDCVRGVLLNYYKDDNFKFISYRPRGCFKFCRPVRKDEVTFYEDMEK